MPTTTHASPEPAVSPSTHLSFRSRRNHDPSEAQADRYANEAISGRIGSIAPGAWEQASPAALEHIPAAVSRVLGKAGSPLPEADRRWASERFGHRFDEVRVHHDGDAGRSALDLGARAYTVGGRIAFAAGEYRPGTAAGRHLLAHELTHVLQQRLAGARLQMQPAPTTTRQAPATQADRRAFIRETINFFENSAAFYRRIPNINAAAFDRSVDGLYSAVIRQEAIIDTDLGGDAALKASLHAAYIRAIRALVSKRAISGGGNQTDLYRINSGRIPLWALPNPSHTEAGVTTPIPDNVAVTRNRGNFQFSLNGFNVTVRPDTRVRAQSSPGLTHINIAWGGISATISGSGAAATVTSFTGPPTPTLTLFTSYIVGVDTAADSAYGRGTTSEDRAGARVTTESDSLAFHESRHSLSILDFIRANPPPPFSGRIGDTQATFQAAMAAWDAAARAYVTRFETADTATVHCVGFTIDQLRQARAGRGQTIRRECP